MRARARARGYADARAQTRGRGSMRTERIYRYIPMCRRTVRTCGGGKRVRRTAPASCGRKRRAPDRANKTRGGDMRAADQLRRVQYTQARRGPSQTRGQGHCAEKNAGTGAGTRRGVLSGGAGAGTRRGVLSGGAGTGCADVSTGAGAPGYKYSRISVMFSQ